MWDEREGKARDLIKISQSGRKLIVYIQPTKLPSEFGIYGLQKSAERLVARKKTVRGGQGCTKTIDVPALFSNSLRRRER